MTNFAAGATTLCVLVALNSACGQDSGHAPAAGQPPIATPSDPTAPDADAGIPQSDEAGGDASESCPDDLAEACATARARLDAVASERQQAIAAGDAQRFAVLALEANELNERLAAYQRGEADSARLAAIASKYRELRRRLANEPATADSQNHGQNQGRPADNQTESTPAYVYHPLEIKAIAEVMRDFGGELYVGETPTEDDGTPGFEVLEAPMPWAGYWFPIQSDELYGSDASPLQKLDQLLSVRERLPDAAAAERQLNAGGADTWEGLCTPWAIAAIMTTEPAATREVDGVSFSVNDQEALLTKVFERYPTKFYGVRYNGDRETDGTFQDLRPEAFHRVFATRLGAGKAFVIDSDPGVQVWSKPVYRVRWRVSKDPEKANALRIVAKPWMVTHRTSISPDPTTLSDRVAPTYEYRLYFDPHDEVDGRFHIIAGEWLGASLAAHPDSIIVPDDHGDYRSRNQVLNDNMEIVREVVDLP